MLRIARWGLLAVVLGGTLAGALSGGEIDELRAQAKQLQQEAEAQAKSGNTDAAAALKHKSQEVRQRADLLEHKTRVSEVQKLGQKNLERVLKQLLQEEQRLSESDAPPEALVQIREQIAELKSHLKHPSQHGSGPEWKLERAAQRLQHLREAGEHLKLAEAHDLAHEVMKQAKAQEQQIAEAKQHLAAQGAQEHPSQQVQDLRAEVERLRAELRELRETIEKRP